MNQPSFEECYSRSRDSLGQALHEERLTPDEAGRYQTFEHGSVHWHPNTGAYVTRGAIRETWRNLDWENGWLGYPTSGEYPLSEIASRELTAIGGKLPENHPELGRITYSSDPLYAQAQTFQNGLIYWIRAKNRCVVLKKMRPASRDFGMTPRYEDFQTQGVLGWLRSLARSL